MKAAVIGYGKSGASAFKLLKNMGVQRVDIFDDNPSLGYSPVKSFRDLYDITVLSPGIDKDKYPNLPSKTASEIEIAWEAAGKNAKIIAVTGTNGKSTTTHLTAGILNNAGIKAAACGNIGLPFGEALLAEKTTEVFVIELSSFQIDLLSRFKADAACILNVTQDHLDRYGSMDNYYGSKLRLLEFIDSDGFFAAPPDKKITAAAENYSFNIKYIDEDFKSYPQLSGSVLDFEDFYADISVFHLYGGHNLLNLSFALSLAGRIGGFRGDVTEYIKNLTGMAHRTETVGIYDGARWINDSKGTNVDSVLTALKSAEKPSFLLLGGRDKKSDYTLLAELINRNVTEVCYFGEAAELIRSQLKGLVKAGEKSFATLEGAVKYCAEKARPGTMVLFSPACSSFDEFKNYEERGEKFKSYVHKYAGESL